MSFCYECNQRAAISISGDLEAAKKKARSWGKSTGKQELIIVRNDNGSYGYRTTDADLTMFLRLSL